MSDNLSESEAAALNRDISQLEGLIEELLTYARLDRPEVALKLQELDIAHWLEERIDDVRSLHPDHQIDLDIPQQQNQGFTDLRLMERVLDNLVNNGLRYSEHRMRISLWFDGPLGMLQVEDDGPGIPPEEREHVFEPFVRLDPSRDRATGGCGLGLAIVYSIAQAFRGNVTIDSSPLGGACVRFCWPVTAPKPSSSTIIRLPGNKND